MISMYSENMVIRLNGIARQYKDIVYQSVYDVLNQDTYKNSGVGLSSLKVDVIEGDANKTPEIRISFAEHLIFLNTKKMQWTALPNMKKVLEWANVVKSNPDEAKRLAWATAWAKKNNDTWKAKPWRKKSLSAVLREMNNMIKEGFDRAIEEDFQNAANV